MSERYELLVGLHVRDEAGYARYRVAMAPLLEAAGGVFRYDFAVEKTLVGDNPLINRVFVLSFGDEAGRRAFFDDPEYQRIRAEHYEPAVASGGIIGVLHPI